MRRKYKYVIIIFFFIISTRVFSQQNFFNVPSSEITPKGKIFFQQQLNIYNDNTSGSSTFNYGVFKNFEIGLNAFGIAYDYNKNYFLKNNLNEIPIFPSLGFNAQKKFDISADYSIGLGFQNLISISAKVENYFFLNNKFEFKRLKFIFGMYTGNDNYFGLETRGISDFKHLGIQGGFEFDLWKNKLFLQSDWMSGKTPSSNLIIGLVYKAQKSIFFSLGYSVPNYNLTSQQAIIFEFTYSPK
ncbi:MAG: hypothetical protein EAZ53_15895 [Bacteroidetes bacterium]|nr:MAG: hypothetical protein EAZ53_15895 [Bacteroidota bacterium]